MPPTKKARVQGQATATEGVEASVDTKEAKTPRRSGRRGTAEPADTSDHTDGQHRRAMRRTQSNAGTPSANTDAAVLESPPPSDNLARLHSREQRSKSIGDIEAPMESVVKVFCVHTEPNFSLPWQKKRQFSSNSSGFIITGRRILTNAHCVEHHTQVKVKRRGSDVKHVATVLAVGNECDIAMLTVEDDTFWVGLEPVSFGSLPRLQEAVTVAGYPIGGDTMSVTSGVVSRIEVTAYVHGAAELLGVQIDAAINSGNSGGPAFNERGECVGIAFQSMKHEDAENIGYIIPTPVISHFIQDYERNGSYTGFPALGVEWQKMENPDLRQALKMQPHHHGVLLRRIEPTLPVFAHLKPFDILLSFDGHNIANDGTVPFRFGERIGFSYLVSQKYTGEEAVLRVLQDGEERTIKVTLQAPVKLVPVHIKGRPPTYFIVAGLVFTAVTVPYLKAEYGKDYDYDAPVRLLDNMMHAMADTVDQQVVVLAHVLAHETNLGYEEILNTQVKTLNGSKVSNMRELVRLVDGCQDAYLHFDLDYSQKVVLSTQRAKHATQEILTTHCIASDRSLDLQDVMDT